jgi:intracellular multiplication protein IcmK
MKTHIVLAIGLAASSGAWAADGNSSQQSAGSAPSGWASTNGTAGPQVQNQPAPAQVAQGTPKAESGSDPLPPPRSAMFNMAQEAISPVNPQEARELVGQANEMSKAFSTQPIAIIPKISALTIDLSPGGSVPLVRTAMRYPSSLSFIDSTGAPWKLGAAPISGSGDFTLFYVPNSNVMVVYANAPYVSANATVYLEGLSVPITINITSGEPDSQAKTWTVDSRLDMRVPRRGPAAAPGAAPEMRIALHDQTLQAFLDGVPPKGARRLKTTGGVPETSVWQLGDDLYVRSRADIRDEFEATLSSADGTHLWKLPLTPYVSFSVMGRTEALNVALE